MIFFFTKLEAYNFNVIVSIYLVMNFLRRSKFSFEKQEVGQDLIEEITDFGKATAI